MPMRLYWPNILNKILNQSNITKIKSKPRRANRQWGSWHIINVLPMILIDVDLYIQQLCLNTMNAGDIDEDWYYEPNHNKNQERIVNGRKFTYFSLKPKEPRSNNLTFAIIESIYNLQEEFHFSNSWNTNITQLDKLNSSPWLYRVIFQEM